MWTNWTIWRTTVLEDRLNRFGTIASTSIRGDRNSKENIEKARKMWKELRKSTYESKRCSWKRCGASASCWTWVQNHGIGGFENDAQLSFDGRDGTGKRSSSLHRFPVDLKD